MKENIFDPLECAYYENCREEGVQQGQIDTIDKIYSYVKRECNPYGKPTIDFESGKKILNYLNQLKENCNE